MRRIYLLAAVVAFAPAASLAQEPKAADTVYPPGAIDKLRLKLNPEYVSWPAYHVIDLVAEDLAARCNVAKQVLLKANVPATVAEELARKEVSYFRYFDCSSVPRQLIPACTASLFAWCNSMSPTTSVMRPRPVTGTDNRLFYIDMRWYGWTYDAWEQVSAEDPYFREPLVPSSSRSLSYMKERIGNGVIRADWFIFYSSDTTLFLKKGDTKADNAFYYVLLYASAGSKEVQQKQKKIVKKEIYHPGGDYRWYDGTITKNAPAGTYWVDVEEEVKTAVKKRVTAVPQTVAEFEKFWQVDLDVLKKFPIDRAAVIDEGDSLVSYHNRVLRRVRTSIGTYWRTFDVFRSVGDQDFIQYLQNDPKDFDAGEHIVTDAKGAQIYFLSDGKGNRVEFGDPRAVRDQVSGQTLTVNTAKSCVSCHSAGIVPFDNEVEKLLASGLRLKYKDEYEYQRIRDAFLQNIKRLVKVDQDEYSEFIRASTGLKPEEFSSQFTRFRAWYDRPLPLSQCAKEVGCEPEELGSALAVGTKGRLDRLLTDGKPIPRTIWENGGYQEAFLLLIEYRKSAKKPTHP